MKIPWHHLYSAIAWVLPRADWHSGLKFEKTSCMGLFWEASFLIWEMQELYLSSKFCSLNFCKGWSVGVMEVGAWLDKILQELN